MKFEPIYITNSTHVVGNLIDSPVSQFMIDLETVGKAERQKGWGSFISDHSIGDIDSLAKIIPPSRLLVRSNPPSDQLSFEVKDYVARGAGHVMIPMIQNIDQIEKLKSEVKLEYRIHFLIETKWSMINVEQLLELFPSCIVHVGLNDLHRELKLKSHFHVYLSPYFDGLTEKLLRREVTFGVGGIGKYNGEKIDSKLILQVMKTFGGSRVIMSRGFREMCEKDFDEGRYQLNQFNELYDRTLYTGEIFEATRKKLSDFLL